MSVFSQTEFSAYFCLYGHIFFLVSRMMFSLWLIAVVTTATEAKALAENEDSTELPTAPAIAHLVDMKTVVIDPDMLESTEESGFEATEMPAIILEGEMLAFINADDDTEVVTTTPGGPDPLQVIQVVNKLDDLPTDNIPLITTPSPEELLR